MDYSQITEQLLIGTTPNDVDYRRLSHLGVGLVINMRFWRGRPPRDTEPKVEYLRLRTFDSPLAPIPMGALIRGARAALEVMGRGGRVYIHCSRGRHRSVALAAAVLIAQGRSAQQAMDLIKARRRQADPDAFHIRRRILRFSDCWARANV